MTHDHVTVDELILGIADCTNNYHEGAVETLKKLRSQSYDACDYLHDRANDA